jgi:RNA recognition motif-containing protein
VTQKPKGWVLVEFSKPQEAKDAVHLLDGFDIDGKKIGVQIYNETLQQKLLAEDSKIEKSNPN